MRQDNKSYLFKPQDLLDLYYKLVNRFLQEEVEECLAKVMLFIPEEQMNKPIELAYADVVKLGKNNNGKNCGLLRIERGFL